VPRAADRCQDRLPTSDSGRGKSRFLGPGRPRFTSLCPRKPGGIRGYSGSLNILTVSVGAPKLTAVLSYEPTNTTRKAPRKASSACEYEAKWEISVYACLFRQILHGSTGKPLHRFGSFTHMLLCRRYPSQRGCIWLFHLCRHCLFHLDRRMFLCWGQAGMALWRQAPPSKNAVIPNGVRGVEGSPIGFRLTRSRSQISHPKQ